MALYKVTYLTEIPLEYNIKDAIDEHDAVEIADLLHPEIPKNIKVKVELISE